MAQSGHDTRSRWLTTNADTPRDASSHQILVVIRRPRHFSGTVGYPSITDGLASSQKFPLPLVFFPFREYPGIFIYFCFLVVVLGKSIAVAAGWFAPDRANHGGFGPPMPNVGIRSGSLHHGRPSAMCPSFEKWGMRHHITESGKTAAGGRLA